MCSVTWRRPCLWSKRDQKQVGSATLSLTVRAIQWSGHDRSCSSRTCFIRVGYSLVDYLCPTSLLCHIETFIESFNSPLVCSVVQTGFVTQMHVTGCYRRQHLEGVSISSFSRLRVVVLWDNFCDDTNQCLINLKPRHLSGDINQFSNSDSWWNEETISPFYPMIHPCTWGVGRHVVSAVGVECVVGNTSFKMAPWPEQESEPKAPDKTGTGAVDKPCETPSVMEEGEAGGTSKPVRHILLSAKVSDWRTCLPLGLHQFLFSPKLSLLYPSSWSFDRTIFYYIFTLNKCTYFECV